jgi:hypothetical protein
VVVVAGVAVAVVVAAAVQRVGSAVALAHAVVGLIAAPHAPRYT